MEQDGEILQSGIVDQITIDDQSMSISAIGWSGYPVAQPYLGKQKSYISANPSKVIKDIWVYLLSFPDSLPFTTIPEISTTSRVGKPQGSNLTNAINKLNAAKVKLSSLEKTVKTTNASMGSAKKAVFTTAKQRSVGEIIEQASTPSGKKAAKNNLFRDTDNSKIYIYSTSWKEITVNVSAINSAITVYKTTKTAYDKATATVKAQNAVIKTIEEQIKELDEEKAEPIILSWDTTDDLSKVVTDMVEIGQIQYREKSRWVGEEIHHTLDMASPKIGARRNNLRFEIGHNVTATPSVTFTEYASGTILFGAGEGTQRIRSEKHKNTGKLRRVSVQTEPQATNKARADQAANAYLKAAQVERTIDRIQVVDHSLAPFGTFNPGDEIRIVGDSGWSEDLDIWVLINSISYSPDADSAELEVTLV